MLTLGAHEYGSGQQPHEVLAGIKETLWLQYANAIKLAHEVNISDPVAQVPACLGASGIPAAPQTPRSLIMALFGPAHVGDGAPDEGEGCH